MQGMTKVEYMKEIRLLENKYKRTLKAMRTDAYLRDALPILQATEFWNKANMLFNFDITKGWNPLAKNISKMTKKQLEDYLDKLQDLDLTDKSTAREMKKFISKEKAERKSFAKQYGIDESQIDELDWEKWLKLYELSSEYVNEAKWLSPAEKVATIIPMLRKQEEVNPRQLEPEFASQNVKTEADWELVVKSANIIRGQQL